MVVITFSVTTDSLCRKEFFFLIVIYYPAALRRSGGFFTGIAISYPRPALPSATAVLCCHIIVGPPILLLPRCRKEWDVLLGKIPF